MRRRMSADQWALGVTGTLLVSALGWCGWGEREIAAVQAAPLDFAAAEAGGIAPVAPEPAAGATAPWTDPAAGAGSSAWTFDVFTPPVIYYNRTTGRFSVTPPEAPVDDAARIAEKPFGLVLQGVDQEPFRVQLVGFSGTADDPIGIFENLETGEGVVARAGYAFAGLGIEIRTLHVRREDMIVPDSMPLREIVAVAEVWDARAGRLVRLSSAARQWIDQPAARLQMADTGAVRLARVGEQWAAADGIVFEVRAVTLEPAAATVVKRHANGSVESITLRAAAGPEPNAAPTRSAPTSASASAAAVNDGKRPFSPFQP